MRILITGSSGQIGSNLAVRLLRDGHSVFGIDKRPNHWVPDAFPTLLQDLAGHYSAFAGGINGVEYPEVDLVVHLAAHAKVHQLVRQPHRALENAIMTFNVLEYARGMNLPIVFSSSREVYGDVHRFEEYSEGVADFAYTESTYSASKIAGEAFVYSYARCYGLRYLVFRFSNVYGRYDNDLQRMVRVLPLWTHKLARGEQITVYGEDKTLDFTYVDDCVDGIALGIEALGSGRVSTGTINLAYGRGNRLLHAAELIAQELGVDADITIAPPLLGEVTHYVADVSKARELLAYEPQVPLEEGIKRSVAWFREWRAEHPEEEVAVVEDPDRTASDIPHGFKEPART
jgi:UDP-glucuronate 4-epimerase